MRRLLTLAVFLCSASISLARDREIKLNLEFVPQETIGASSALLQSGIAGRPVQLVLVDARPIDDRSLVGQGQSDGDQSLPVRSTGDVARFLESVLLQTAGEWGVSKSEGATLILEVKVTQFLAKESDRAFGSMYRSDAGIAYTLRTREGKNLYSGSATGGTNRYGRSRNTQNFNEVLSDAIKEAYAYMFDDSGLQDAWLGKQTESSTLAAMRTSSISPEDLRIELIKLKEKGFSADLMLVYLRQKTLTSSMTASDMLRWKEAGLPEPLIQEALRLDVPR